MYNLPKLMAVAFTAGNVPTVLYIGQSMGAAYAAVLAVHTGGTYARVAILRLHGAVVDEKHSLPLVGPTLTKYGG